MSERSEFEKYQAFMVGYVNRINKATLNVTIGGIRIGTAKYSRLAQINLHSRIITFSRFAIENVPERGRRYLVLHELAHVREANHTKRFWELVALHEPNFKQIGHALDIAFKKNVRAYQQELLLSNQRAGKRTDAAPLLSSGKLLTYKSNRPDSEAIGQISSRDQLLEETNQDTFECMEEEFDLWSDAGMGAIQGGSDIDFDTAISAVDRKGSPF